MQINRSSRYLSELFNILEYISRDKISASINFKENLDKQIDNLVIFPYKY